MIVTDRWVDKETRMDTPETPPPAGSAVAPRGADAVQTQESAREARAALTRQVAATEDMVRQHTRDLEAARRALEAEFAAKKAELEATIGPLREQLKQAEEVLWTADLYLGRHEQVRSLRGGDPAPEGTPITVRQKVLSMAEESLVLVGDSAIGMEASDLPGFIRWVLADDAHLDQVLPEAKGVVVLVPNFIESRSENIWEKSARDAANTRAYWLIRNGQRLHLMTTDPELRVGRRVLPNRREFIEVFDKGLFGYGRAPGVRVQPGSAEWMALEKQADARRRHYMRLMLVLQGLIDRTSVWHPLPPGGVNLLDDRAQADGDVVLVQDDDAAALLTDGREDFRAWQARVNARMRPGVRVIGHWRGKFAEHYVNGDRWSRGYHPRLHPGNASHPTPEVPYVIEDRRDGMFVIRYERTDEVWRSNVPVPDKPGYVYASYPVTPKQRASCLVDPGDDWVLALDLANEEDLRYYLSSRANRSKHLLSMVPVLRAALAVKEAEAEQEAPFRALLASMLTEAGAEDAPAVVGGLIHDWKIAHAWHRPLNGEPAHEARAAKEIVAAWQHRQATTAEAAPFVAAGQALPGAVAVARRRDGTWVALAATPGAHPARVFLDVTTLRRDGKAGATKTWQTLSPRQVSALTVAWSAPEWEDWTFTTTPHHYLTGPQRDALLAHARQAVPDAILVTEYGGTTNPDGHYLTVWSWTGPTPPGQAPVVEDQDPLARGNGWKPKDVPVVAHTFTVTTAPGTDPTLGEPTVDRRASWTRYSMNRMSNPWWPDDAYDYGDTRHRLAWADQPTLHAVQTWRQACHDEWQTQRDRRNAAEGSIYARVADVQRLIVARVEADAYAEFVSDYGTNADDLWDTHRQGLRLASPVHDRDLWGLLAIADKHDVDPTGMTLNALVDLAAEHDNNAPGEWHPTIRAGRVVIAEDVLDVVVPARTPTTEEGDR